MFLELQKYLGIGRVQRNRNNVTFVVSSIEEIVSVLIPLFEQNPLLGGKLTSYLIFK